MRADILIAAEAQIPSSQSAKGARLLNVLIVICGCSI